MILMRRKRARIRDRAKDQHAFVIVVFEKRDGAAAQRMRSRQSLEGSVNHSLPPDCPQSVRLPSLLEQQRIPRLPLHSEISVSSRRVVDFDAARNQFRACQVTAAQQIGNHRFLRQHGIEFVRRQARGFASISDRWPISAALQTVNQISNTAAATLKRSVRPQQPVRLRNLSGRYWRNESLGELPGYK